MKTLKYIYIGQGFYGKSMTRMPPFYRLDDNGEVLTGETLGTIESALSDGYHVHIRPANKNEMEWANRQLEDILRSY